MQRDSRDDAAMAPPKKPGAGKPAGTSRFLQFQVSIHHTEPRIWRRFLIRDGATFMDLHRAIQACGWTNSHLWTFTDLQGGPVAGLPMQEDSFARPEPDARTVPLTDYFKSRGDCCTYTYDFGDYWVHDVKFEGRKQGRHDTDRVLLAGAGSFPPRCRTSTIC